MIKDVQIKSDIQSLDAIEHLIDEICACTKFKVSTCENIIIATIEAVTNCIIHGNKKDANKKVNLHIEYSDQMIHIEVSDEGDGFDINKLPDPTSPENLEAPHGRGIYLMRMLADEFTYDYDNRKFILKFIQ